jgi:hypothetical protein
MNLSIMLQKRLLTVISLAIVLFMPENLLAGISIEPRRQAVSLKPGEEGMVMYHIHNTGDEDIDIVIEPKAWSGIKDPYKWMSLEDDTVYVRAGESAPFIVKVNAPGDAKGEMLAMLFLCYRESTESQLNIRNGVPLYMVVKGTEEYGLVIEDAGVSYAIKGHFYNLNFVVKIKNTGNVHIVPDVRIIIKNDKGRVLNMLSLKRPNIVLREKKQIYRLSWRNPELREGIYTAEISLDYEDKIKTKAKKIRFQVSGNSIEQIEQAESGNTGE